MGEILCFAIISTLLLFGFIVLGVNKFGLLHSYSTYAYEWPKVVPIKNMNLWSIITIAAAFLITPVLLELASASAIQFVAFLVPVYLMVVALTPEFLTNKKQGIIHRVFTVLCMTGGFFWLFVVMKAWLVFLIVSAAMAILGFSSKTLKTSNVFWLEMVFFLSVYITVFLVLL